MALIVQKFGGTSVADTVKIRSAAQKAIREAEKGNQVVMVVSAMGKSTDHLITLAKEICDRPNSREMDMLLSTGEQVTVALMAIALESFGYQAISLTGAQMGIRTDSTYNKARIRTIATERMQQALKEGKIIIAAGFQGIDDDFNITTLGRGGSDTTAVALAAALKADYCDIYTDVDGVYTTDPRIVPEARRVAKISYDEMLEMASLGAGVMHSRSIEFAKKFGVLVHVRSSFNDTPGTIIGPEPESNTTAVCGVALAKNEARFSVVGVPDKPGVAMKLFSRIAEAKIPTDMIAQNISSQGKTDISFTVPGDDYEIAREVVEKAVKELGAESFEADANVSKVSVVGLGMESQAGVAPRMFHAISGRGINISMITTGDIKISALVSQTDAVAALRAVHEAFELHYAPENRKEMHGGKHTPHKQIASNPNSSDAEITSKLLSRLSGMEDIVIEHVGLDESQMRLTLTNLPDRPGLAAAVFDKIADKNIFVDMIVQSIGHDNLATISFTVPRKEGKLVDLLLQDICDTWQCKWSSNPTVAKLTVCGTGLRSHTGLAYRMFKALSDSGINVNIICTGERNINVTVDQSHGELGYKKLKEEFAGEMI